MHFLDRLFRFFLPITLISALITVISVGIITERNIYVRGYTPAQPINFSHYLHAGINHIPCLYCHGGVLRSRHALIPSVETCMNCHTVTKVDSQEIKKIKAIYEANGTLKWERIYRLPDHVYFDHRPHVNGGIACQECHGEIERMERVGQVMSLRMGNCLKCHKGEHKYKFGKPSVTKGSTDCNVCHR